MDADSGLGESHRPGPRGGKTSWLQVEYDDTSSRSLSPRRYRAERLPLSALVDGDLPAPATWRSTSPPRELGRGPRATHPPSVRLAASLPVTRQAPGLEAVDREFCRRHGLEVVRRPTGRPGRAPPPRADLLGGGAARHAAPSARSPGSLRPSVRAPGARLPRARHRRRAHRRRVSTSSSRGRAPRCRASRPRPSARWWSAAASWSARRCAPTARRAPASWAIAPRLGRRPCRPRQHGLADDHDLRPHVTTFASSSARPVGRRELEQAWSRPSPPSSGRAGARDR